MTCKEVNAVLIDATSRPVIIQGATHAEGFGWHQCEQLAGAFVARYEVPRTREAFLQDLKYWLRFLADLGVRDPITEPRSHHFELYCRHMEEIGRAQATRARRFGTVFIWYEWLVNEEDLTRNHARRGRRPKYPTVSTTPWLTRRQLVDLLEAGERLGGYDAVTLLILGLNALRVAELCSLNVECVTEVKSHRVLNFIGKGNKPAVMPLPPRTIYALDRALDGRTSGPLILTRTGTRATRDSVSRCIQRGLKEAGISTHISPHGMRHSCATAALDAGVPIRDVQLLLRHANSSTTNRYDRHRENLDRSATYSVAQALAS